ncbi:MAG TPA: hypothetical protein VK658_05725 [Chryseolinea sp.]|nr:hypothetical protein [Chryseolinea sp.]
MTVSAKAPEAGYAYVFVSNEHPFYVDVYFDDVTLSQTPSPIVGVSDYFPFGLPYNAGERAGALEQKYLYNGKELQDELVKWLKHFSRDLASFLIVGSMDGGLYGAVVGGSATSLESIYDDIVLFGGEGGKSRRSI